MGNLFTFICVVCLKSAAASCDELEQISLGYIPLKIASPGYYTDGYDINICKDWNISSSEDGASILYRVTNMTLHCAGDAINIYDGTSEAAPQQITNECSPDLGKPRTLSFRIAKSGNVYLTFVSDGTRYPIEWGFHMYLLSGKSFGPSSCHSAINLIASTTVQYLSSPNFPEEYSNDLSCTYNIVPSDPLANVYVMFHFVDIEFKSDCSYDSITISEVSSSDTVLTICDEENWEPINITLPTVSIIFLSDHDSVKRGFFLSYQQNKVDGSWSSWSNYSGCTVTCGSGVKLRERSCDNPPPSLDGIPCPDNNTESEICNSNPCPVNGIWGEWTNYTPCSVTCDEGVRNRSRLCDNPAPAYGGLDCEGNDTEIDFCNEIVCPVDGNWGEWNNYTPCSLSCGEGIRNRSRLCDNPAPAYGGLDCEANDTEVDLCNEETCPVDGNWGEWDNYTQCSVSCGGGIRNRSRLCNNPAPTYGGLDCAGNDTDVDVCKETICPVHGLWGLWSEYSECFVIDGKCFRNRTRYCDNPAPEFGGLPCFGNGTEVKPCSGNRNVKTTCLSTSSEGNGYQNDNIPEIPNKPISQRSILDPEKLNFYVAFSIILGIVILLSVLTTLLVLLQRIAEAKKKELRYNKNNHHENKLPKTHRT